MTARDPETVILRQWKESGDVIALWPFMPEGNGLVNSYEHVGQHGAADYNGVIAQTRPADPRDPRTIALENELEWIGYHPVYRLRRTER